MTTLQDRLRTSYCSCHEAYTSRKMQDPTCEWCNTREWREEAADKLDRQAALLREARELIQRSQFFHAEDFAEDPAELDHSCVSAQYLAHYKNVLAFLAKTGDGNG